MFSFFKTKVTKSLGQAPEGECAYAIGDIHGCYQEMRALLHKIEEDAAKQNLDCRIVFLGDLIDRGPDSRRVIDYLMNYKPVGIKVSFLMGNHEEVFLQILDGNSDAIESWFTFGGKSCVRSYGVDNLGRILMDPDGIYYDLRRNVPKTHTAFLKTFEDYIIFGDYIFVHAGIRPGVKFEDQNPKDFRWIRKDFLKSNKPLPYKVVHGHTIVEEAEIHDFRIAVDTGCHDSGVLTAVRLIDDRVDFIQTDGNAAE